MSIELGMNVEGVENVQMLLERLPELMHTAVMRALNRVGADIHMNARQMCPVKTGYLRDSIYHRVQDWILTVGAEAEYATYVEFGSRYIQGRYFLTEAFHLNLPKLESVLGWAIDDAIRAVEPGMTI